MQHLINVCNSGDLNYDDTAIDWHNLLHAEDQKLSLLFFANFLSVYSREHCEDDNT
jgi:hypothetical protein